MLRLICGVNDAGEAVIDDGDPDRYQVRKLASFVRNLRLTGGAGFSSATGAAADAAVGRHVLWPRLRSARQLLAGWQHLNS